MPNILNETTLISLNYFDYGIHCRQKGSKTTEGNGTLKLCYINYKIGRGNVNDQMSVQS